MKLSECCDEAECKMMGDLVLFVSKPAPQAFSLVCSQQLPIEKLEDADAGM